MFCYFFIFFGCIYVITLLLPILCLIIGFIITLWDINTVFYGFSVFMLPNFWVIIISLCMSTLLLNDEFHKSVFWHKLVFPMRSHISMGVGGGSADLMEEVSVPFWHHGGPILRKLQPSARTMDKGGGANTWPGRMGVLCDITKGGFPPNSLLQLLLEPMPCLSARSTFFWCRGEKNKKAEPIAGEQVRRRGLYRCPRWHHQLRLGRCDLAQISQIHGRAQNPNRIRFLICLRNSGSLSDFFLL